MTTPPAQVCEGARDLERIEARLRHITLAMIDIEGYERWGNATPQQVNERWASMGIGDNERSELRRQLEEAVERWRQSDPEVLRQWAEAHIALRQHALENPGPHPNSTADSVARKEIAGWTRFRDGEEGVLRNNAVYARFDPELYEAFFGFSTAVGASRVP